ncbi:hypothetical protein MRB53_028909 [Persea americana]|uniref:Uncharacterized protein n=1 Tax=Persea americana TaxID=3435 RepID=A0ACC2KHE0_PERAE|nr:hypothetical protein MRB53_028909 [Persea americana]
MVGQVQVAHNPFLLLFLILSSAVTAKVTPLLGDLFRLLETTLQTEHAPHWIAPYLSTPGIRYESLSVPAVSDAHVPLLATRASVVLQKAFARGSS